jgi:FtsP/CotA-like multicopper oxidase with cupredoxin domain
MIKPVELVSSNGGLHVTLDVDMVESLEGIEWSETGYRTGPGYNGAAVGPTLRVKPGDKLTVTLNNNLDPSPAHDKELYSYVMDRTSDDANVTIVYNRLTEIGNIVSIENQLPASTRAFDCRSRTYPPSDSLILCLQGLPAYGFWGLSYCNLHFHGMDFSPKEENLLSYVDGGDSQTYIFKVPEDKEPGLYWYHNHVHGLTTHSYLSSLFGMIVVEGTSHDLTTAVGVQGSREILMVLTDGLVNPDGSVPLTFPIFGNFNWTGVTNGNLGEQTVYNVTQGDQVLFRAVGASSEPTLRLSIPNVTFVVLAYDGIALSEPEETDVVTIPGGGRVEFLARFETPGEYVMTRARWAPGFEDAAACADQGLPFYPCLSFDKKQVVAKVVVTPKQDYIPSPNALVSVVQLPTASQRLRTLAQMEAVESKKFVLQLDSSFPIFQIPYDGPFVPPGVGFGVNDRLLTPHYVEDTIVAGTCETWEVISDPPDLEHSFHIHQASFLVLARDGVALENPVWHDTILIQQNATIHVCFDRAEPGDLIMAHCHMATHFDIGMGTMYLVTESRVNTLPTPSPVSNATTAPTVAALNPDCPGSEPPSMSTPRDPIPPSGAAPLPTSSGMVAQGSAKLFIGWLTTLSMIVFL